MEGGSVSRRTVTVNVQVAEFWQLSVTRQVTVVAPNGKTLPDGGLQTTTLLEQPPETVGGWYCQGTSELQVHKVRSVGQTMVSGLAPGAVWAKEETREMSQTSRVKARGGVRPGQ